MKRTFISALLVPAGAWLLAAAATAADPTTPHRLVIRADQPGPVIDRNIYGHFSEHLGRCIYEGYWVGEDSPIRNVNGIRQDVVEALKRSHIPVLRWPGGCFADEYHWKDGIGPRAQRPTMINTHWGGVTENNHFGSHEFFELCAQLGCEPYLCGNVGSGTVREMQEWVEYITFDGVSPMADLRRKNGREQPWKLKYFGVGNENWGCGGNMTAEFYADQFKRYATYVRNFGGNQIQRIACGPYGDNYHWTEVLMKEAGGQMQGLALHYYCGSGKTSRSATRFNEEDWYHQLAEALKIDGYLTQHSVIMNKYDPEKRVALIVDEWGAWHDVEPGTNPGFLYQQNTMRDALVAGISLNIFNRHAARVRMANIAQTVNVLQAMVLTDKEKILLTPTYHVFEMYSVHHDAASLPCDVPTATIGPAGDQVPVIEASASRDAQGTLHLTVCNLDPRQPTVLTVEVTGKSVQSAEGRLLTADTIQAHNTFDQPDRVRPTTLTGIQSKPGGFQVTLPPRSVSVLTIR